MYKVAQVVVFAPEVSVGAARECWRGARAALSAVVPGSDRYVQNLPSASLALLGTDDARTAFDGYACVWYPDRDAFRSSLRSAEWSATEADAATFVASDASPSVAAVEECVVIDGPAGPFKAVWFVRFTEEIRADSGSAREAHEY